MATIKIILAFVVGAIAVATKEKIVNLATATKEKKKDLVTIGKIASLATTVTIVKIAAKEDAFSHSAASNINW